MTDLESVEHFGGRSTEPAVRDRPDVDPHPGPFPPVHAPDASRSVVTMPRMGVLRDITDHAVFEQVLARGRVTRAELATVTGISKPTISDAVRRMSERGILVETGFQTGRRGRIATFYELSTTSGWVLAVEIDADGISLSAAGLSGQVFSDSFRPLPGDDAQLIRTIAASVVRERRAAVDRGPLRVIALSLAHPFDPASIPRTDLAQALDDLGDTRLLVDTDVNFAARAERCVGTAQHASSFGYIYLGTGIGSACHFGDQIVRGAHGRAGEIGQLPTTPGGTETVLQALAALGYARTDRLDLDVPGVRAVLDRARAGDPGAHADVDVLCDLLVMAVAGVYAVNDPELLVLGGPLGRHPVLLGRLQTRFAKRYPSAAPIAPTTVDGQAALRGALLRALADGRQLLMRSGG